MVAERNDMEIRVLRIRHECEILGELNGDFGAFRERISIMS